MSWTQDRIDTLLKLAPTHSMSQIAKILGNGITRSACIGKIHRIEKATGKKTVRTRIVMPKREPKPHSQKVFIAPRARRIGPSLPGDTSGFAMVKMRLKARPKLEAKPKLGTQCGVLHLTGCKWPTGFDEKVPGGHLFCNDAMFDDRYCEHHAAMGGASYSDELIQKTTKDAIRADRRRAA